MLLSQYECVALQRQGVTTPIDLRQALALRATTAVPSPNSHISCRLPVVAHPTDQDPASIGRTERRPDTRASRDARIGAGFILPCGRPAIWSQLLSILKLLGRISPCGSRPDRRCRWKGHC